MTTPIQGPWPIVLNSIEQKNLPLGSSSNLKMDQFSTCQLSKPSGSLSNVSVKLDFFFIREEKKLRVQVNLFQKHLFLHQLTYNMTKDCSLNYEFSTWKIQTQKINCSECQYKNQFVYTTCYAFVVFMYWTNIDAMIEP